MNHVHQVGDKFITRCIIHNVCLDFDFTNEGWSLGDSVSTGGYGLDDLKFGGSVGRLLLG